MNIIQCRYTSYGSETHNNKPLQENIEESYLFVEKKKRDPLQY